MMVHSPFSSPKFFYVRQLQEKLLPDLQKKQRLTSWKSYTFSEMCAELKRNSQKRNQKIQMELKEKKKKRRWQ